MDKIYAFLASNLWDYVANIFTIYGIISVVFSIIRYFNNGKFEEWRGNISITDFEKDYDIEGLARRVIYSEILDDNSEYATTIVFSPVNCVVNKLKVIKLNSEGKEESTVEEFKKLTPETPVCFKIERAECIPKYKLRWYIEFGEYCEYQFIENRRNGINEISGSIYKKNFLSKIKKSLGLF